MIAPFALPAGVSFDGEMRAASMCLLVFTDHNTDSPCYRATFTLREEEASTDSIAALHRKKIAQFAAAK